MAGARPETSYDFAYVEARLAEAGLTLRALPASGTRPAGYRAFWPEIAGAQASEEWSPPPSARAISQMEQAFGWLGLIPDSEVKLRKLVGMRSLQYICPTTEEPVYVWSWVRLGEAMGCRDVTAKAWHRRGLDMIVLRLNRPGLCQIL